MNTPLTSVEGGTRRMVADVLDGILAGELDGARKRGQRD